MINLRVEDASAYDASGFIRLPPNCRRNSAGKCDLFNGDSGMLGKVDCCNVDFRNEDVRVLIEVNKRLVEYN